jgi:hypothetical protein
VTRWLILRVSRTTEAVSTSSAAVRCHAAPSGRAFAALRADAVIASRCGASWVVVGGPIPQVQRRWAGVYSEVDPGMAADALYHRAEVEPGLSWSPGQAGVA